MGRLAWLVVLVCACGSHATVRAGDQEAARFERGAGVPRDYTRALQWYQDRCDLGRGDLVACRKFAVALQLHRGEARDGAVELQAWLSRACQQGDWLACVPPLVPLDGERASAACDAGDLPACVAATWAHAWSQSGTVESVDRRRLARACLGDLLEACELLARRLHDAHDHVPSDIAAPLQRACEQGDADACAALGRPIAPAELCRAHDFAACAQVGDAPGLEQACDHAIVEACERLAINARDAEPPDPRVAAKFARACALGSSLCVQNRPDDLAIGCAAYRPARVPAARRVQLAGLRDAQGAPIASGRPFLMMGARAGTSPGSFADLARRLAPEIDVFVLSVSEAAALAPAHVVALAPVSAAAPLAAGPASPGDPRSMHLGDGWPTIVDRTGKVRAVLSLDNGFRPTTLARCTRGLLALP